MLEEILSQLNLEDARVLQIVHSEAMIADVYRIEEANKLPLILKIHSRASDFHRELYFLTALRGVIPVPRIVATLEPSLLMECLEGSLLEGSEWTDELAFDCGATLAKLHSARKESFGDPTHAHFRTARAYFQEKFFEELEECKQHLPERTINKCIGYFNENVEFLDHVDGPCLVHRDFRPGNIFVKEGRLAGVIDWAAGRFGFAEQDFYTSFPEEVLHGYSSIRKLPYYKGVLPLLRIGKALGVVGYTVLKGTWQGKDQEVYRKNRALLDLL